MSQHRRPRLHLHLESGSARTNSRSFPMSGADWTQVSSDGAASPGTPNVGSQDSQHDIYTLAAALTCVRNNANCTKARSQVVAAIGTEGNNRWLAISRNLGGYIIAADLLGLRDDGNPGSDGSRVEAWIRSFLTRQLPDNNTGINRHIGPFHSGSNAAAQEGFIYAAIGAYINDTTVLNRAWDAFRTYACDPTAPDNENIDLGAGVAGGWAYNDSSPCAVNPLNSTKVVPGDDPVRERRTASTARSSTTSSVAAPISGNRPIPTTSTPAPRASFRRR